MRSQGLTLAEVIVSAVILLMATGGVMLIFSTERAAVTGTGRRMQAMDFSRQVLEKLKNDVSADTWPNAGALSSGTHDSEAFLSLSGTSLGDIFGGTREYTVINVGGGDPVYKKVTVEVEWQEPEVPE